MTQEMLRQEVEDLLLMQRVAQRVNSTLELETLLEQTMRDVAETFEYCRAAILLQDDSTDDLVISRGWTGEGERVGDRLRPASSRVAGHVTATRRTFYAPDVHVERYHEIGHAATRSEVDIPLIVRDTFIGILNVQHSQPDGFSPSRIRLLEALADHLATAIDNARMFERVRLEKNRLWRELREAQTIQAALLPPEPVELGDFTVAGVCVPCRTVGGDWFDYLPLGDGRTAVILGDVAGKGSAAALLMSSTRSLLRLIARDVKRPAEVLAQLNRILLNDFPAGRFVTLVYAVLDPVARQVTFANAGHWPPLLADADSVRSQETPAGLPLGTRACEFSERVIDLPEASRVVLYSDGILEASNGDGEEYGLARIERHVQQPGTSAHTLVDDVRRFTHHAALSDDATVVMIEAS
jgi:phosphoserine phosphatase RsbU/P